MTKATKKAILAHLRTIRTSEAAIKEAFRYEEQWEDFKLHDQTEYAWLLNTRHDQIFYTEHDTFTADVIEKGDALYSAQVIGEMYVCDGLVLFAVDTRTDGNKYIAVFDFAKRCSDPALVALIEETW